MGVLVLVGGGVVTGEGVFLRAGGIDLVRRHYHGGAVAEGVAAEGKMPETCGPHRVGMAGRIGGSLGGRTEILLLRL
ncbi:MAG: hypothetical protein JSU94_13855 [Phycisphaerales bacterium]|nr:MAG: hypothetical protein JSU94_13855 [Phycisphaerales bacterium]